MGLISTVARMGGLQHSGKEQRTYLERKYNNAGDKVKTKAQSNIVDQAIRKVFSAAFDKLVPDANKVAAVTMDNLRQLQLIPAKDEVGTRANLRIIGSKAIEVLRNDAVQRADSFETAKLWPVLANAHNIDVESVGLGHLGNLLMLVVGAVATTLSDKTYGKAVRRVWFHADQVWDKEKSLLSFSEAILRSDDSGVLISTKTSQDVSVQLALWGEPKAAAEMSKELMKVVTKYRPIAMENEKERIQRTRGAKSSRDNSSPHVTSTHSESGSSSASSSSSDSESSSVPRTESPASSSEPSKSMSIAMSNSQININVNTPAASVPLGAAEVPSKTKRRRVSRSAVYSNHITFSITN